MNRKHLAIFLAVLIAMYFVGGLFISDETRVRWKVNALIEAFNAARAGSTVATLADDYKDALSGANRDMVRQYLTAVFLKKENRVDGSFKHPARLAGGELTITVGQPAEGQATVKGTVELTNASDEDAPPSCVVGVEATLSKASGEWLFTRSRYSIQSGRIPF